jgi:hypothetical protein
VPPFQVDGRRLYEVGTTGATRIAEEDPETRRRRLVRLRWLFAIGIGANAATWSLAGAAFVLGGRHWGAAFGGLALVTVPLLALPALVEAWAALRARRRHHRRPRDFPAG